MSYHADRFGSFRRSLSSFHSSWPLIIPLQPGDHLASTPSLPVPSFAAGGGAGGERRPNASSLVSPGTVLVLWFSAALTPPSASLLLGSASSLAGGALAAAGPAPAVGALSSLAPRVGLALLQSGSRPVGPVLRLAVAPLVVPSICGGGSCPWAIGPVAAVAALVPAGWVSSSLFLVVILGRFAMSPIVAGNGPNTSIAFKKMVIYKVKSIT